MYKQVYYFLTENNIIYYIWLIYVSHALINLTENISQALDEGYIGCGIFVDLQKAFGTVDHEILNLTTLVFEVYQIIGLNPTFLITNSLFL